MDDRALKCWMVRHGKVEANGKIYGTRDVSCLPISAKDTEFLRSRLPKDARYVTSKLQRTQQTLKAINADALKEVQQEACLNEQSLGVLEGIELDKLQYQKEWHSLLENFSCYRPSGGESLQDVVQRVGSYMDALGTWWASGGKREKHCVLVVHAGVIRAALIHCLQLDVKRAMQFDVAHLSLSVFAYHEQWVLSHNEGWRLLSWNERS